MKKLAYLLIAIGCLGGSLVAVQTPSNQIAWKRYLPALLIGCVGVVLARAGSRSQKHQAGALSRRADILVQSLDRIVENITRLDQEKETLPPHQVHHRIDQLFRVDLDIFVETRESMMHLHGLQAYAVVMNEFAAGERHLNRVWSASVDGYVDEVRAYIASARAQFEQAQRELRRLSG